MSLLDIVLGYDCNLWCDYCTITKEMRERALTARQVVHAMRQARREGYERVALTGGEPSIRSDLLPLIREARKLGFCDIKLQTNGLLLAEAANVARLVEAGVTRFHVSIHTHRPTEYERLVRREGTFPLLVQALENLVQMKASCASTRLECVAEVILKEDTYRHLPEALAWIHSFGMREAWLWFVSLTDGNRHNLESLPKMIDVIPFVETALKQVPEIKIRSLHLPICLLGPSLQHIHLNPAEEGVRVLSPDGMFDLSDAKLTPNTHTQVCEECDDRRRCPGMRRDYLDVFGDVEIASAKGESPSVGARRLQVLPVP
ncbi:MAG: radical SAM protein [Myxococcota bacterium]